MSQGPHNKELRESLPSSVVGLKGLVWKTDSLEEVQEKVNLDKNVLSVFELLLEREVQEMFYLAARHHTRVTLDCVVVKEETRVNVFKSVKKLHV